MNYHLPVMLNECIEGLNIRPEGTYVDATFGGGGHSRAILSQLGESGRLIAFDQDADALANAIEDSRFKLLNENFRHMKSFLRLQGVRSVDGILGELDLRMDRRQEVTARELVNRMDEHELTRILRLYGELPNAYQMAKAICRARTEKEIETTFDLREAVKHHLPRGMENKYLAMLFQALRIEVNGELEALQEMLRQAAELLNPGGRIAVMSYHSLEDRIVKNFFRAGNFEGEIEKDFYGNPIVPLKPVSRKAIVAGEEELQRNPRSRSARLRVAEKVEAESRKQE